MKNQEQMTPTPNATNPQNDDKKKKRRRIFWITLAVLAVIGYCVDPGQSSSDSSSSKSSNSIEGTYTWSDGYGCSYTLTISGNSWYGSGKIMGEYKSDAGVVKGNTLYDQSGYIDVARVSGNSISYGPITLHK